MGEERLETRVGDIQFVWTRCCGGCGVHCFAGRIRDPNARETCVQIAEYTFVESIEKTALRSQEAALEEARKVLA